MRHPGGAHQQKSWLASGKGKGGSFEFPRVTLWRGTDNKAAGSLTICKLKAKLPVVIVLMECLSQYESMSIQRQVNWRPRDTNVEADDLTNERFHT